MPYSPTATTGTNIWDRDQWTGDAGKQIDVARNFGALGNTALLGDFQNQLGMVGAGLEQQNNARSQLTELATAPGRAKRVRQFGADRDRAAYKTGEKIRAMKLASGGEDIGGAAQLAGLNQSARDTANYSAMLESPEGQAQIYQAISAANSPQEIMSILGPMLGMSEQDLPRFLAHLQDAASDRGGAFGQILGAVGQIAGGTDLGALF